MTLEELRERWTDAERDLAGASGARQVEALTQRAEQLYEEYMRAKEADATVRRVGGGDDPPNESSSVTGD